MNLDIKNWKPFFVGNIFRIEPTKGKTTDELEIGNDIPYIGAKHNTQGLIQMCKLKGFENWVSKGNCIVFIQLGAGSAGYVNYIPEDFIGMNGKTSCGYIDGILNEKIGMFLETILCKERPKYSFGRSWTGDRLKNTIIKLPIKRDEQGNPIIDTTKKYSDKGYIPDWNFMENYIKTLNYKPITTNNKKGNESSLNVNNWRNFIIKNLFRVELSKGDLKLNELDEGTVPLVSSGDTNNGIVGYVDERGDGKAIIFKGNKLTIDMFGKCYYQSEDFYAVSHGRVNILNPMFELNKNIGLFLSSIINAEQYRFSYGRAVYSSVAENIQISLPIQHNEDGTPKIDISHKYSEEGYIPDWNFMENYIKSLPYGDKI